MSSSILRGALRVDEEMQSTQRQPTNQQYLTCISKQHDTDIILIGQGPQSLCELLKRKKELLLHLKNDIIQSNKYLDLNRLIYIPSPYTYEKNTSRTRRTA